MTRSTETIWLLFLLLLSVAALVISGCEGGVCITTGCVDGYVYATPAGADVIISADDTPPAGYEPVAGARVYIEGEPDLEDTTDANGFYKIWGVPPGMQTVVVEALGAEYRFTVVVRAGRCTSGGGHLEGGGGF